MSEVLVLDRSYRPHARWTWQDTMIKWAAGECDEYPDQPGIDILATYEDRIIHAGREIFMPCVVALRKTFKPDYKSIKFSRHNLYARDKGKCQYCGIRVKLHEFEYEHVIPKTQGGKTNWENIVVSCHSCNQRKRGRTPEQAGMRLRNGSPRQPRSLPPRLDQKLIWEPGMPQAWRDFGMPTRDEVASYLYWHSELDSDK